MAVGFSNTNKPINPRGQDASPLAYNRAKLYSGKALDFDGSNDELSLDGFTMSGNIATLSFYLKADDWDANSFIFAAGTPEIVIGSTTGGNNLSFYDSSSWQTFGAISDTTSTNFFSIVFDGTTAIAYMNGVKFGDTLTITAIDLSSVTGVKLMAKYTGGAWFFNGQIAGFKIFNTALTPAQVADLYNNPEKVVPTGVDNTALKLWLPMMEGAGTYCINGADPLGNDEYNGAGSFDSSTGWTLNTGFSIGSGSLSCNGTQTAATSAYYNISSVASSLVMVQFTLSNVTAGQVQLAFFGASGTTTKWYTANGTYTEYVEVQAGHNGNTGFIANADFVGDIDDLTLKVVNTGAISGATWTHGVGAPVAQTAVIDWNKETTGAGTTMLLPQGLTSGRDITGVNLFENVRKQGALNLDGNSWAEVHDNASLDITTAISLEMWIYWEDQSAEKTILGKWLSGTNRAYALIATTTTGEIDFRQRVSSSTYSLDISTLSSGWNHVVATHDHSANERIGYINGVQVSTSSSQGVSNESDNDVSIGGHSVNQYTNAIAQPRIYNRALTAAEVLRNYNSGKNTYK